MDAACDITRGTESASGSLNFHNAVLPRMPHAVRSQFLGILMHDMISACRTRTWCMVHGSPVHAVGATGVS